MSEDKPPSSPPPTSTDHMVLCCRCHERSTFMSDGVCFRCRNKDRRDDSPEVGGR